MPGIGTLINISLIIIGSIVALFLRQGMKESLKETLMKTCGLVVLMLGLSGTLQHMLIIKDGIFQSTDPLMMLISLILGAIIGELIDIEKRIDAFGEWLKRKSGNSGDSTFTHAFLTASITFCVGAMGILGSIQDGIQQDPTTLIVKGILDGIVAMIFTSALGKGALFSFIPVGIMQLSITALSSWLAPYITPEAMSNLSYVGSILIFSIGLNLIWPNNKIRVGNLLPAIILAVIFSFFPQIHL